MAPHAVADEAAHDRESRRFDDDLHRVRHVADTVPELRLFDTGGQSGASNLEQPLDLTIHGPHPESERTVGNEAAERHADVDRDHISALDDVTPRDPVHNDIVRRDADL